MSVEKIIDKIIGDARADRQTTLDEAQQRAAQLAATLEQEADGRVKEIEAQSQREIEEVHRRQRLTTALDGRKLALGQRRALLDDAFDQALVRLGEIEGEAWQTMIINIVLRAVQTGEEKLQVPAADRPVYKSGFLDQLNDALRAAGKQGALTLDDTPAPFAHGVALIGPTSDIVASTEALLTEARSRCEARIAAMLLGDGEG